MTFQRLSILGVGLLGGSIGLKIKSNANPLYITGYGHNRKTLDRAIELKAIESQTTDLVEAVRGADFVILCTPVGTFSDILRIIAPVLKPGAIVTDVGSTKNSVCALAESLLSKGVHFVGSHPMAGSDKRGIEAARADLFDRALCITTPTATTKPDALDRVESFWKELGMHITRLDPADHDRLLADVSHLPHALAAALVSMQSDAGLPLAGRGFLDSTRIAAGDASLWRDIFLDNADNLRESLQRLRGQLDRLESMLEPTKAEELRQWLDAASERRKKPDSRSGGGE